METSGHDHSFAVASYLRLWKRWWAVVGDRRVMTPEKWTDTKQEINDLLKGFKKLKENYDM